eukprot:7228896-Alexandrium_andersonii.AAC.1
MLCNVTKNVAPGTAHPGTRQEISCKPTTTEGLRLRARLAWARMPQPQTTQCKKEACRFLQGAEFC